MAGRLRAEFGIRRSSDPAGARVEYPAWTNTRQGVEPKRRHGWQPRPRDHQGLVGAGSDRQLGIVTAASPQSRVLAIDIDTKPGKPNGWESIFDLLDEYQERLPETTSVTTPSSGRHLHFAAPEGEPPVPIRQGWLPGVDIPWMVPVPPSAKWSLPKLQDGSMSTEIHAYRWASIVEPLPVAPAWLVADIRNRGKQPQGRKLRADVRNRSKQPQVPIGEGRSQGHSAALRLPKSSLREVSAGSPDRGTQTASDWPADCGPRTAMRPRWLG
jgi:Bifunctional DNA primase/polymerase, N-terminal